MRAPSPHHLAALALLTAAALPAPALAQEDEASGRRPLITTLAVLGAPTTTVGWMWLEGWITDRQEVEPDLRELRQLVLLRRYLDAHEAATRDALALGRGPALDDLRALLHAPTLPAPQTLRALGLHRAPWTPHTARRLYLAITRRGTP